jgi:hypothetical protein
MHKLAEYRVKMSARKIAYVIKQRWPVFDPVRGQALILARVMKDGN